MQIKNMFSFGVDWNYKTVSMLVFLAIIPNFLGMINISTPLGFKVHFFQLAIIAAAMIYGPMGGLMSGLFGSIYSAIIMNNPYIIGGNIILGIVTGILLRKKIHTVLAVLIAFAVQLPWLILTDFYLVHLPVHVIKAIIIALLIMNTVWALVIHYSKRHIKRIIGC